MFGSAKVGSDSIIPNAENIQKIPKYQYVKAKWFVEECLIANEMISKWWYYSVMPMNQLTKGGISKYL